MRNRFRIIGGEWRGRRFEFPDEPALRPSPDRVRETLFNWLAPVVAGARCADLFAGSGALGLEALSRGAASVVFVDRSRQALDAIDAHLARLYDDRGQTAQGDVTAWLEGTVGPFDIVFMDPPFGGGLVGPVLAALAEQAVVADGGRVYIECEASAGAPALPTGWRLHRSGKAGQVGYHLAVVSG